jgi:ABC-2 type transport system permease protein
VTAKPDTSRAGRPHQLRAYRSLARAAARSILTYRLGFLLGLFGLLFQLLAMLSIWRVLLRSGASIGGFTWPEMKAYLLIAYGSSALAGGFTDRRLGHRIRDGMVAVDLVKPVDFQRARFAETVGGAGIELLSTAVVVVTVVVATGGVAAPRPYQGGLFVLSALFVLPLNFCLIYLTALVCFWTQNIMGVSMARWAVTSLFSGALVPLSFLPGWLQAIASVLPFASVTYHPALIYLGRATGGEAWKLLAIQAFWVTALWIGARLVWHRAVRQLTVHGG